MASGKENALVRLEAENKRLKRLIKRMHQGAWSVPLGEDSDHPEESEGHLSLYISALLMANMPFEDRINKVLQALGQFADVSRIYIFENFDNEERMRNSFEWCNDGVQAQKDNLQDLSYNDFPQWKQMLLEDGIIEASDIKVLPKQLCEVLATQEIESILVFPLMVANEFMGFIGFDECSYNREWLPFEVDLLKLSARLVSNAYETEFNQLRIQTHGKHQKVLFDVSRLLISDILFADKIDRSIKQLTACFSVEQVYVYENGDNNRLCSLSNYYFADETQTADSSLSMLNFEKDLPGWLDAFDREGCFNSHSNSKKSGKDVFEQINKECSTLALPIRSEETLWGFIILINKNSHAGFDAVHERAFSTVADMFASAYEREDANCRVKQNHDEILNINRELEQKETFLQNLLSSAPVGIMLVRNRLIEYVNSAIVVNSGFTKDELVGMSLSNLYYNDTEDMKGIKAFYKEVDKEGIASMEVCFKDKIGDPMYLRVLGTQVEDNGPDPCYMLIGEDISIIKETEKSLQESEERNRKVIETTIDGIFILNSEIQLVYANASGLEILGYEFDELAKLEFSEVFPDKVYHDKLQEAITQINNGQNYIGDVQLLHKTKTLVHTEIYATGIQLNGKLHFYFSVHNISKRKKHEEALVQSEHKFRALTENSPDHILRIDTGGSLSFCNAAFLKDFGLDIDDCIGKKLKELKTLPIALVQGLSNAVEDALLSTTITPVELEFVYKKQMYAFDWTITPETDVNQKLSSLLLVGRNFTLRKRAEQELLIAKERAESADNLKSAFLANMSHEIRTPLNAIVGFTNLLSEETISPEEKADYIKIVNNSSENLMELINDIVDLAKIESGELNIQLKEANPNVLLEEVFQMFDRRMDLDSKKHLKFYLNIPVKSADFLVLCDLKRLNQVMVNLVGNAFKFTPKGFIEMGYTKEVDGLRFYVRDTGVGISPEKSTIIFEPFRQEEENTSTHYGGTGLGLSISKRLVSAMDGTLELISEKNKGSEFYFTLPMAQGLFKPTIKNIPKAKPEKPKLDVPADLIWPDKIVLLVDATSTAQLQMRKHLERTKITLISARTPNSARELLLKRNDVDLVLMDVNMPGLNPEEFIRSIRQLGIKIPFIAQSVKVEKQKLKSILTSGFDDAVSKPIVKDELLQKINIALNNVPRSQLN